MSFRVVRSRALRGEDDEESAFFRSLLVLTCGLHQDFSELLTFGGTPRAEALIKIQV